jgi:hypothetical protein
VFKERKAGKAIRDSRARIRDRKGHKDGKVFKAIQVFKATKVFKVLKAGRDFRVI